MKHNTNLLVPIPKEVTPIAECGLIGGSEAIVTYPEQLVRRGQCFRLRDGSMARCSSVRPRLGDKGELVFDHIIEPMSETEVRAVFGDGDPEEVQSRRLEAQEIRRIARRLERYEGLKPLVPVMNGYADSLDGGCSQ